MKASSPSPEACLFVANLPSRLGNEELSFRLLEAFNVFGRVVFIKTSRDGKGRPFGFVQYEKTSSASLAMNSACQLVISGRKVRIEKARCLRKLQITVPSYSFANQCDQTLAYLKQYAASEDIVFLNIDKGDLNAKEKTNDEFSIVIKLIDSVNAEDVFDQILTSQSEWKLSWLNANATFNGEANSIDSFSSDIYQPEDRCQSFNAADDERQLCLDSNKCAHRDADKSLTDSGEQEVLSLLTRQMQKIAIDGTSYTFDTHHPKIENNECEVFVGRLTSSLVDEHMVCSRFSQYGELNSIHMVNKKAPGMPQDAFAFLKFKFAKDAQRAIEAENGKKWLGQHIKVSWAIPKPHSSSLRAPPAHRTDSVSYFNREPSPFSYPRSKKGYHRCQPSYSPCPEMFIQQQQAFIYPYDPYFHGAYLHPHFAYHYELPESPLAYCDSKQMACNQHPPPGFYGPSMYGQYCMSQANSALAPPDKGADEKPDHRHEEESNATP